MSFKVIGIGEVLWDLLPSGPQLGGAPANFAYHARQLGARAKIISRVGRDEYGKKIIRHFEATGIGGETVQVDDLFPTGMARVVLDAGGVPNFVLASPAAWDFLTFTKEIEETVADASAICFGTLAQRNRVASTAIQQAIAALPVQALKLFDINLRESYYNRELIEHSLHIANALKLNEHELTRLEGMFGLRGACHDQIEQLAGRFELQIIALTRGDNGSLLFQSGNWSDFAGEPVAVADTVGAGDAFSAALVMGILNRFALEDIHRIATKVAGYVCSCHGATPTLPLQLCSTFLQSGKART